MNLDERIEAAARNILERSGLKRDPWSEPTVMRALREDARAILSAAFPELFSSPPTGWITMIDPHHDLDDDIPF